MNTYDELCGYMTPQEKVEEIEDYMTPENKKEDDKMLFMALIGCTIFIILGSKILEFAS